MSTKPASLPQWDTNLTHTTALVAGHKNDGYASNEVPASDELNFWMNLVYQWVSYVNSGLLADELTIPACAFQSDANAAGAFNTVGYWTGFSGAGTVIAALRIPVGRRILTVQQFYNVNSTGASLTPTLKKMQLSTGTVTSVWAGSGDNTGSAIESQTSGTLNHTVLSGYAYFLEVTVTNAGHRVHGAIVTSDQP